MKDLDFDELDKAVNSLMGGVKEKDPSPGASKTLDISTTLAPDERPSYTNLSQVAEKIGSEAIDKQENTVSLNDNDVTSAEPVLSIGSDSMPLAGPASTTSLTPKDNAPVESPSHLSVPPRPSSGRFMDVVHPSSDMRSTNPKSVSREGVTIATPTSAAPEPLPESTPESPNAPVEPENSFEESVVADTTGNLPVASASESMPEDGPEETTPSVSEPLSSPFIPDAKVEKRPLGGTVLDTPIEPEPAQMEMPDEKKIDELEQKLPTTESVKEGSSVMDAMTEPVKSLKDVTEHVPEEYKDELLAVEKNVATDEPVALSQPAIGAIGTVSIPKQYHEKESSGDESNGAIFDTTSYHKPLVHPAKKKSGWTWVIVIVVILLLGAGAGAAAYFLGFV